MGSILEALAKRPVTGVLRQLGDTPEHAAPEMTSTEEEGLDAQVQGTLEDLARAEKRAREMPRGHLIWKCPGCTFEMAGVDGGVEHGSFLSHIKRHPTHVGIVMGLARFSAPR